MDFYWVRQHLKWVEGGCTGFDIGSPPAACIDPRACDSTVARDAFLSILLQNAIFWSVIASGSCSFCFLIKTARFTLLFLVQWPVSTCNSPRFDAAGHPPPIHQLHINNLHIDRPLLPLTSLSFAYNCDFLRTPSGICFTYPSL